MDDRKSDTSFTRLGSLPVQVSVRVCSRSLKLDEMLQWVPGTILTFDRRASEPLAICIGHQTVGNGHAVTVGPNFGLRLSHIGKDEG